MSEGRDVFPITDTDVEEGVKSILVVLFTAVAVMFVAGVGLLTYFFGFVEALQVVGALVAFWIVSAFFPTRG